MQVMHIAAVVEVQERVLPGLAQLQVISPQNNLLLKSARKQFGSWSHCQNFQSSGTDDDIVRIIARLKQKLCLTKYMIKVFT